MIGRLISGRYSIEAKVGSGGMAVVYRAHDNQTDTTVAIKMLRPEYEADMEFVRQFGFEAEAAAKVFHENIVNMLSVGIDGEKRYIVMEYVDGVTLKEMIRDEGKIHPDVALRMTIRILAAVDHAHRNGIVHRDIKPQNILVDREGRVKVADFGIARLKTTQAEEEGKALGSVHYISPEQARGEVADEQSDLYSVGVVLYEMLTGSVPFDGQTTTEIALKHVNEQVKSMRKSNPHISKALDEVVLRALCKSKEQRYQTAAEMAADLRKTIDNPRGGFVVYPQVKEPSDKDSSKANDARRRKNRGAVIARILLAFGILAVLAAAVVGVRLFISRNSARVMPELRGMPEDAAVQILTDMEMVPSVVTAHSEDYEAGCVMIQSVEPEAKLYRGSEVVLTVSLGTQWFELPDMVGWTAEDACAYLELMGAGKVKQEYIFSDKPIGTVVSTDPAPGSMSCDAPLTLWISGKSVLVPPLDGLTLESATAVLEAEGLRVGAVEEGTSADAHCGSVIGQSIAPYTRVITDSAVDLKLCQMRTEVYAPDSPLTVVVPMHGIRVSISVTAPSGQSTEAYAGEMKAGTHSVALTSAEAGLHNVRIYMGDVLFETVDLTFE